MVIRSLLLLLLAAIVPVFAESGIDAWLRYARLPSSATRGHLTSFPDRIVVLNASKNGPLASASSELHKGIKGILGLDLDVSSRGGKHCSTQKSIVISTLDTYQSACGKLSPKLNLKEDGYWLSTKGGSVQIIGQNERGALYGAFQYLSYLGQGDFSGKAFASNPSAPVRWSNQWDNLNAATAAHGSIERGYGGPSIFFENGLIKEDLSRVPLYGRLLASVGLNGIVINNVNADANLLNETNLQGLKRIADLFRPWGVNVGISLNFASPQVLGDLSTFDPLDDSVIKWWTDKTDRIYQLVPDLAGYLVKANSEGQPGPLTYNRTLAEGANLFAKAVQPHGGIVVFRAFVYDQLNETDWKADRANAAVDFFKSLDGQFDDNVLVQIKYGPIDFQVREPASPLFANLPKTAVSIELEVTQEYLGQQSHLVYLPPLWQTVLGFDMRYNNRQSYVRDIISGEVFGHKLGGYAGVINVGMDDTWLGSHLAMSNMFAYGRLAWNPRADSRDIVEEWTRLTFGLDRDVVSTIADMSLKSWPAYEGYSGNLGIQTLTDILYTHYGANPASQDNNGWGQWTRADSKTIGMDRTVSNGTGNAGQYPKEVAARFEHTQTTPDDLMLWFHHVPYTFRLHSGKSVIQHFYDAHYTGAATVQRFPAAWKSLKSKIDTERYNAVLYKLQYQTGHSLVWRDAITEFYRNLSSIPDQLNRVRNHPHRIEAEDMDLSGFTVVNVSPTECASKYKAIATNGTGTATTRLNVPSGKYTVAVNYYDVINGTASYDVLLNGKSLGKWKGDSETHLGHDFSTFLDCHSAIRITFEGVRISRGDKLTIRGTGNAQEQAAIDYVSILPQGVVD
ncbi:glycoside hydrolase family 67 [Trichoderma reesei QM6a]|jgi:alpha-glucuronidase|uniref:Alpha-glucuronidase n=3 Tax=Hypocrea jecorina TaxID=51453 RepID=AGUA_HYPJE|nr:glycoside hydrolase family 67 [Trichoderma reesei QM6a]Q99024.1 RecName: Full=Alpha-glucuronidase; AltName: Full=Alpha-glucosiduronase; AltName: Full=GLRI; Flags: Precursor [Trichoderma reesei]EGR44925.1 glycoside hydrolase family 67 [Trichoderma reesei QM6a]ETR97931.1 alpha-glucuronidase [Trichoderma reesei RUT C-30]CAA92949.1 alpha-glucuronidase [Trichoderma reesei]